MKLGRWMAGVAAIACAAGCNKTLPLTDADRTAIADSVSQIATQWTASFATQPTVENVLSRYVHGNSLVHAENGMIYPTYDALVTAMTPFFKGVSSMRVTLDQKRFTALDRDVVVMTTLVNGTLKDSAGKETPTQGAWTAVWHRTSDGWKIVADHEFTAPPPPAAPAKPKRRAR